MDSIVPELARDDLHHWLLDQSVKGPVVFAFWAPWCSPCRRMLPVLDKVYSEYHERLQIFRVEADNNPDLANQFGVRSLPTIIVLRERQVVEQYVGKLREAELTALLENLLSDSWNDYYQQAKNFANQGRFADAITYFDHAYRRSNKLSFIAIAYATTLMDANEFTRAQDILDDIREVNRNTQYESLVSRLSQKLSFGHENITVSELKNTSPQPLNIDAAYHQAQELYSAGRYKDSAELLLNAVKSLELVSHSSTNH